MDLLDGFKLDADITVSELRQEDLLDERLRAHRRLRLRRRNEILGVVVGAADWRALAAHVRDLEAQIERHEDEAVRTLIAQRTPDAEFVQATAAVIAEIDRQSALLVAGE